ncbi:hypothetical protein ACR22U_000524 [Escherichia coli]|nr:hypothetical protein [Escherichia coli]WEM50070.1 hypothetical protein PX809_001622 [Escherichia coli]WEM54356.1 hypothetical protein PX810_001617 [Escherichia coli]WEM58670.1 hypothetical protein PX811_001623 [Escherichia coli]WNA85933.1 hypothetical protein PSR65_11790 [Escherichia coli]WQE51026.1 hypothetical protein U0032_08040 [Escherichia coli]
MERYAVSRATVYRWVKGYPYQN